MSGSKPTYKELVKRLRKLEKENSSGKKTLESLRKWIDSQTKQCESYKTTADLLELYLDEDWRIVDCSNNFLLLTESIVGLRIKGEHVRNFLQKGDFEKIQEYLNRHDEIKNLPFNKGREWELRYKGPSDSEKIGNDWLPFSFSGTNQWRIENGKVIHQPLIQNDEDCYLMAAKEYGNADEDVKVIYKVKTSKNKNLTRDLSLVLSGASADTGIHPDLAGYTACSGSKENTVGRIQKKGLNLVVINEKLDSDTEYQITVERTGGKLERELVNLNTGMKGQLLEIIDTNVIYDRQNHIGFTTFAGEAEFYDIEIYTRKSIFNIDQFKIPFDVEVGINDPNIKDKIFKLRIGGQKIEEKNHNMLLFEDITERKQAENELKKSRERLRDLAAHLQIVREEEQSQIAREIHDELGQSLTALHLELLNLRKKLPQNQDPLVEKTNSMLNLIDITNQAVQRISTNLRPGLLDDLGLISAMEWQFEEFQKRTKIKCEIYLDPGIVVLDENLSTTVFRIFQEVLTNIARHANASKVFINFKQDGDILVLKIQDDGKGITESQIKNPKSFGIIGIRERLFPWQGKLEIIGTPQKGTSVTVTIPLTQR